MGTTTMNDDVQKLVISVCLIKQNNTYEKKSFYQNVRRKLSPAILDKLLRTAH